MNIDTAIVLNTTGEHIVHHYGGVADGSRRMRL